MKPSSQNGKGVEQIIAKGNLPEKNGQQARDHQPTNGCAAGFLSVFKALIAVIQGVKGRFGGFHALILAQTPFLQGGIHCLIYSGFNKNSRSIKFRWEMIKFIFCLCLSKPESEKGRL